MKVLVTGANGYIGTRLLLLLAEKGHDIVALARVVESVYVPEKIRKQVRVIQGDLLKGVHFPEEIEAAYYLVHSMSSHSKGFDERDRKGATHFIEALSKTKCKQVIYLTGLITTKNLSKHLRSRLEVETILKSGPVPVTVFRAGIIIGSGSASFEIIRDLVEKLPIMVAPKWLKTRCQPIAISDVLFYLSESLGNEKCLGKVFDIGGPNVLTYREMLLEYARIRKLKRWIVTLPLLTPNLSSLWLIFITSTNFYLARTLVDSMTADVVCQNRLIDEIFPRKCLTYQKALERAFQVIKDSGVVSSWHNAWSASGIDPSDHDYIKVPEFGCYKIKVSQIFSHSPDQVFEEVYHIGDRGEYFSMNWAWRIRGLIDRYLGGVGLRRGRTKKKNLQKGDVIDFWRVILIDKAHRHLILLAEMKVPGEAWLEFQVHTDRVDQIATFRPRGVLGRLYWGILWPIHKILFPQMIRKIVKKSIVRKV